MGAATFAYKCYATNITPRGINDLLQMSYEVLGGNLEKHEKIRKDALLLNYWFPRDPIHDSVPGVNEIISKMVENDFKLHDYDLVHALGHGVGLEIHESPVLNSKNDSVLKDKMIITNEPGIYIPGKFGVRIEDTILITKAEATVLTKSDKEYIIIKGQ